MIAWFLGVQTVRDGWPDRSAGWWVVYLAGFVVIGVLWYAVDQVVDRRKGRPQ